MKKYSGDWRLAGGFSALLLLIVAIGVIGILQIQSLSTTVSELGRRYFPMQEAALEMRINNSLYATGVRNYIFWRRAKYLEAAKVAANRQAIDQASQAFDHQLESYLAFTPMEGEHKQWVEGIKTMQEQLRSIGSTIVALSDQLKDSFKGPQRENLEGAINKLMMDFENRLYGIDDFLDTTLQKSNLEKVKTKLHQADLARKQAIAFLSWSLIFGLLIGGETAWLVYRNRRRERQRREELVRRTIKVEEEQRENLSLQVHDQMGQDLSGLRIYLDVVDKKLPSDSQDARGAIQEGKRILSGLIEKSHNIAELLRPPALDELGLVDTIEGLILQYRQMSGLNIVYWKPKAAVKLSGEYSLLIYRVTQEGLTNIIKHAQAKKVEVKLELDLRSKVIQLVVKDDGQGLTHQEFLQHPQRRKEDRVKLGLLGLKERVELLGGTMHIKSVPKEGTRLLVELPLEKVV